MTGITKFVKKLVRRGAPRLANAYYRLTEPSIPNLRGDRDIEYSWVVANMPEGPGEALDFGCGPSWMGLVAARKGYLVTCIDMLDVTWNYQHPNLRFLKADILQFELPEESYDLIINSSSVEHVGLYGRYGVSQARENGDIEAMARLQRALKPGKLMLLTIPVGVDSVLGSLHRVYGTIRMQRLLDGWEIWGSEFWTKDTRNRWCLTDMATALTTRACEHYYALGLFILRRPSAY